MLNNMTFKESLMAKVNSINSYVVGCQETTYDGIGNSFCNIYVFLFFFYLASRLEGSFLPRPGKQQGRGFST